MIINLDYSGRVEEVVLKLEPATGDDHDKKYVCLTLHLALPAQVCKVNSID